jgi:hypothetical protein
VDPEIVLPSFLYFESKNYKYRYTLNNKTLSSFLSLALVHYLELFIMSNDQNIASSSLSSSTELVETLSHLVDRMASLERRLGESSPMETANPERDSFITERAPDTEFTPYPEFSQALPSFEKDFFRNPLPEVERRRFLSECPRNVGREYTPPPINSVNTNQTAKRYDSQLADVQFRLSGITRPLDSFLHKILRNGAVSSSEAIEFVNVIHELLLDSASHITQLRIDNMFRGAGIQGQAPRLANSTPAPLLDPKVLLEHVSLHKSVSQVGRTGSSRNPRGKANSSINNPRSENEKSDKVVTHNHSRPNDHQRKGFHSGQNHRDKGKRPENSQ